MRRDQSKLLEIMAANLNEFCWDGEEMAILSGMFKQTAQQLAEQKYRESINRWHWRLVGTISWTAAATNAPWIWKTCAVIPVIARFETICTIESRFLPNVWCSLFQEGRRKRIGTTALWIRGRNLSDISFSKQTIRAIIFNLCFSMRKTRFFCVFIRIY